MSRIIDVATGEIGYREGRNNDTKYGREFGLNHVSWCGLFVRWVYKHSVGVLLPSAWASVDAAWHDGRAKGMQTRNPVPGDVTIFHFPGEHAGGNHMGIFTGRGGGRSRSIDGNTGANETHGGGVLARDRPESLVLGYLHVVNQSAPTPQPPPQLSAGFAWPTIQQALSAGDLGKFVEVARKCLAWACNFPALPITQVYDTPMAVAIESVRNTFRLPGPPGVIDLPVWHALEFAFKVKFPNENLTDLLFATSP